MVNKDAWRNELHAPSVLHPTSLDMQPQYSSDHPADYRLGLWDTVASRWPPAGCAALDIADAEGVASRIIGEVYGRYMPAPDPHDTPTERAVFALAVLREEIIQASLNYSLYLYARAECAGYMLDTNVRRGIWVSLSFYALHVALRDSETELPGLGGDGLRSILQDCVIRRLAHEVPEAWAMPAAVDELRKALEADFARRHELYSRYPQRWLDDITLTAAFFVSLNCAEMIANKDEQKTRPLFVPALQLVRMLAEDLNVPRNWINTRRLLDADSHAVS